MYTDYLTQEQKEVFSHRGRLWDPLYAMSIYISPSIKCMRCGKEIADQRKIKEKLPMYGPNFMLLEGMLEEMFSEWTTSVRELQGTATDGRKAIIKLQVCKNCHSAVQSKSEDPLIEICILSGYIMLDEKARKTPPEIIERVKLYAQNRKLE